MSTDVNSGQVLVRPAKRDCMFGGLFLAFTTIGTLTFPGYFTERSFGSASLVTWGGSEVGSAQRLIQDAHIPGLQEVIPLEESSRLLLLGTADGVRKAKIVLATQLESGLIVRRFELATQDPLSLYKILVSKKAGLLGIKRLILDPTDNSLLAQGTKYALERLAKRIQELDQVVNSGQGPSSQSIVGSFTLKA